LRRAIAFGAFLTVSILGSLAWSARVTRSDAKREQLADSATRTALSARRSSARGVVAELARHVKAEPEKTPIAPVARTGLVRIRAYPVDATISLDGRDLGRGVVLDAVVPAGRRRLRVHAAGYVDFDSTVTIVADETTQLPRIDLRPREVAP
jgi:hypothetical protein